MLPGPKKVFFSLIARMFCLAGVLFLTCPIQAKAENTPSNIVCREDLSVRHRNELERELRKITGFLELWFDRDGALRLDRGAYSGGSITARALLVNAIYGRTTIILEDASRRPDVVFARVIPGKWKHQPKNNSPVFVVLIDFADFDCLMGDEPALRAFDVGWALLHELDHVLEDSEDSSSRSEVGECEEHVNQMRQECNLPLRADYFHSLFPVAADNEFRTKLVRLSFVQENGGSGKKKRYWVMWDATVVGGLDDRSIATLR